MTISSSKYIQQQRYGTKEYWEKAYWDLMNHTGDYWLGVHKKNEQQAARIMLLEAATSFVDIVGDTVYINHTGLQRWYKHIQKLKDER